MNLGCDFECTYCYQRLVREKELLPWDIDAVEKTIRNLCKGEKSRRPQVVVHGGEPLTLPEETLERLLALSYELTGRSSIQTNGFLINESHMEKFRKYKTGVGVSIDGPWPCNEFRGKGSHYERREQTEKILANLRQLIDNEINTSVIVVVHKANGLKSRIPRLKEFIEDLNSMKIAGRLNPCCSGIPRIDLTVKEAVDFYSDMFRWLLEKGVSNWSPFRDIVNVLSGDSNVVCVFRECDPYNTQSATSVLHDGSLGVCLRLYQDGIIYLRDTECTSMRSSLLRETDCKDCRWFQYCLGGCSGLSHNFDWRRKDRFCEVYKRLFELTSNAIKFVRKPIQQQTTPSQYEHLDGPVRHLDSSLGKRNHSDGLEHLDGDWRHLDSN